MVKPVVGWLLVILMTPPLFAAPRQRECLPAIKPDLNNDGVVNYKDLWMVGRSFRLPETDYRYIAKTDTDCDGRVDESDWLAVWRNYGRSYPIVPDVRGYVILNAPAQMYEGRDAQFTAHLHLVSDDKPFTVNVRQRLSPRNGLRHEIPPRDKWVNAEKSRNKEFSLDLQLPMHLRAEKIGRYQIGIGAEIPESGQLIHRTATIRVLPAKRADLNVKLEIVRDFPASQQQPLLRVLLKISGSDVDDITKMQVIDQDSGESYPVHANFSAVKIKVSPTFIANKQCKHFYAVINTPYDTLTSEPVRFCAASDPPRRLLQPVPQLSPELAAPVALNGDMKNYICRGKRIVIIPAEDVSARQLSEIVTQAGGKVVFHESITNQSYLIEPNNVHGAEGWFDLAAKLEENQAIRGVSLHLIKGSAKKCGVRFDATFNEVTHDVRSQ